jgi:hypothetical protein
MQTLSTVEVAKKQRHLGLLQKVKGGQKLSANELLELEEYEAVKESIVNHQSSIVNEKAIRTDDEAARYCGVTPRTIRAKKKDYPLKDGRGNFIPAMLEQYVKKVSANDQGGVRQQILFADLDLKTKKGGLAQWELDLRAGKYVMAEEVQRESISKIIEVKRVLLSLPRKLSAQLEHKARQVIQAALEGEMCRCLDVLAGEKLASMDPAAQVLEFYGALSAAEKKQFKEKICRRGHKKKIGTEDTDSVDLNKTKIHHEGQEGQEEK